MLNRFGGLRPAFSSAISCSRAPSVGQTSRPVFIRMELYPETGLSRQRIGGIGQLSRLGDSASALPGLPMAVSAQEAPVFQQWQILMAQPVADALDLAPREARNAVLGFAPSRMAASLTNCSLRSTAATVFGSSRKAWKSMSAVNRSTISIASRISRSNSPASLKGEDRLADCSLANTVFQRLRRGEVHRRAQDVGKTVLLATPYPDK